MNKLEQNGKYHQSKEAFSSINQKSAQIIENSMINVTLLSIILGYTMVYFNAIKFDHLIIIFSLNLSSSFGLGFFTASIYISACAGAFLSSYLLKTFSRNKCFYVLNFICIISAFCIQIKNFYFLLIGRLFQGLFIGAGSTIVPLYIKEFVPQLNGKYGLYHGLGFSSGVVLAFSLNLILHEIFIQPQNYWRILFGFPVIINIFQMYQLKTKYNFQTPRYLISMNLDQKGIQLLRMIYKKQYVDFEYKMLKLAIKQNKSMAQMIKQEKKMEIQLQKIKSKSNDVNSIKQLQTSLLNGQSSTLKPIIIDQITENIPKLSFLPIFCALHLAFQQQIIGVGPVIVYSGYIIKENTPELYFIYPIVVNLFGVGGVLLGIKLVNKFGRVYLMQAGGCIICLCLLITGVNFVLEQSGSQILILLSMIAMRTTLSCTIGPIVWLYMPEITSPGIIPYAILINYISSTIIMFTFPIAKQKLGNPGWIFLFNAFMCALSTLINSFTLIQTKDKNQIQIKQGFYQKSKTLKQKLPFFLHD